MNVLYSVSYFNAYKIFKTKGLFCKPYLKMSVAGTEIKSSIFIC